MTKEDYPALLVTEPELTEEEIQTWQLPPGPGFWYIELSSPIACYLELSRRGRRTHIPGIAKEYIKIYGDIPK